MEEGLLTISIGSVLLQDGRPQLAAQAFRTGLEFLQANVCG
jgi:hypothetical protein